MRFNYYIAKGYLKKSGNYRKTNKIPNIYNFNIPNNCLYVHTNTNKFLIPKFKN